LYSSSDTRDLHSFPTRRSSDLPGPGEPKPLDYVVAHLKIAEDKPVVIGAPLAGAGWVAGNGCCNPEIIHRGSVLSVNGALYDARSEEHTSELQSLAYLVCRLLL